MFAALFFAPDISFASYLAEPDSVQRSTTSHKLRRAADSGGHAAQSRNRADSCAGNRTRSCLNQEENRVIVSWPVRIVLHPATSMQVASESRHNFMMRRTSSQLVGDGNPKPRPYPKSSAMVFEPNPVVEKLQMIRGNERRLRNPARTTQRQQVLPQRDDVVA